MGKTENLLRKKQAGTGLAIPRVKKTCAQGILYISFRRKNAVLLTLTNMEGKIQACINSVSLSSRKIRIGEYVFKELGKVLKRVVQALNIRLILVRIQGSQGLKIQRLLLAGILRKPRGKKGREGWKDKKKSKKSLTPKIRSLTFVANRPHNGCRPKKVRRK